jgi:hypothetical protein
LKEREYLRNRGGSEQLPWLTAEIIDCGFEILLGPGSFSKNLDRLKQETLPIWMKQYFAD